jgi:hypothetical protein
MTLDEAGRRHTAWQAKKGSKVCQHGRVVDYLITSKRKNTGYLVCLECGEAFIDPMKNAVRHHLKTLAELTAEENEAHVVLA